MSSELSLDGPDFWPPSWLPSAYVTPAGVVAFYVSSHGFVSCPNDTPANVYFDPRAIEAFTFERSILGNDRLGGRVAAAFGELALWNGDRFYDALVSGFAIDGRRVVVKTLPGLASRYADATAVFDGVGQGWRVARDAVRLTLRDSSYRLEVPIQTVTYGGGGGTDGGADLKGKPKPTAFGKLFNITPVLVDAASQTYQANFRAIKGFTAVRERGLDRTEVAAAPGSGQWVQDRSTATFQLGFTPSGPITCDLEGDVGTGVYVYHAGTIIRRILLELVGFASAELDLPAFDKFAYDAPGEIGIYLGAAATIAADVLDAILAGVGGFGGQSRAGLYQVGLFTAPSTTPVFTLYEEDIDEIEELELPAYAYPPPKRIRVGYQRNWSPTNDIAAGVTDPTTRAKLVEEWREAAAFSSTVANAYFLAGDPPMIEGLYAGEAAATAEATRLLALYAPTRHLFRVKTKRYRNQIELGHVGAITHSDYSATRAGFLATVARWADVANDGSTELVVFG